MASAPKVQARRTAPKRSRAQSGVRSLLRKKTRNTVKLITTKAPHASRSVSEELQVLLRASEIFSSSLDYKATLASVANLAVPRLADWCSVHIQEEDGTIRELALAHADPKMIRFAEELRERYPSDYSAPGGIGGVIRTGKPLFLPVVSDEMLVAGAKDTEHLKLIRRLNITSVMAVPLVAHGRTLGAISFIGERYTEQDLAFAEALASRAALAVENALLFREKARFAAIIESSTDAIIGKTLEGIITSWNEGAGNVYGYTAAEMIGKHISALIPAGQHDEHPRIVHSLQRGDAVTHYEMKRRKKDGTVIDVSLSVSPIRDAQASMVGVSVISRDITELMMAREKALKSEEALRTLNAELEQRVQRATEDLRMAMAQDRANLQRLKAMLSHLPMGALMMDNAGNVMELNDEYCRTFSIGMAAAEAMKLQPLELNEIFKRCLLKPDEHMKQVNGMLAEKKTLLGHDILLKDGRVIQREFLPIFDRGEFLGQLFLYRDVTRERRMDAAKSEFMSLASHQLRTPLTSMRWAMSMLGRSMGDRANEFEQKLLEEGRQGAARMSSTIDTMLQISRIESGEMQSSFRDIRLKGFLEEIVKYAVREHSEKKQSVSVKCADGIGMRTDPNLLKELLGNLMDNALKYTPKKGSILLEAAEDKGSLLFTLQDSGYGIPEHQQPQLFKKFFRGENVVDKDTKGTGLGLYLVSLLCNLLGGTIECQSMEGRGTTFRLRFPVYGSA